MVIHSTMSSLESVASDVDRQLEENNRSLAERERVIGELQRELGARDRLINQQRIQLDEATKNLSVANKTRSFLTMQIAEQDRKMALIQRRTDATPIMREELHVVNEALASLRKSFRSNDPQHHTLDTIEQSISLLMERLHSAEMQTAMLVESASKHFGNGRVIQKKLLSLSSATSLCAHVHPMTKVIYFTDGGLTPCMSSIEKRLGQINLRDFKLMLAQPGEFRYHFKSMDPEFGIVKEEVLHDDDVLPGIDGKIIAWVEGFD